MRSPQLHLGHPFDPTNDRPYAMVTEMRLAGDWNYVEQAFDCSLRDHFLMALRSLDNPKAVTPFLLEQDGQRHGIFLEVERGNVESAPLPPDIRPIYYRPYFTFDDARPDVHQSLVDAIAAAANGKNRLFLDPALPMAVATQLTTHFTVAYEGIARIGTVTLRQVQTRDVLDRAAALRGPAGKAALRLLDRSPIRRGIAPYLEAADDARFSTLDRLMGEAGVDIIVVSSTLNAQELAGVPVRAKRRPLAVVYCPGAKVWVLEEGRTKGREYPTPAEALADLLPKGRIGVESEDVDGRLYQGLQLDEWETVPADQLLRTWRDFSTLPDLAFYIIAARASAAAIESALTFANNKVAAGDAITEMDAYTVYLDTLHEFVAAALPELRVARTLTNFHSGARTIFPANPAAFPLNKAANTLKIDAGCLLFDRDGLLLGCSDIARTLSFTEAGSELYASFQKSVRQSLVPLCGEGKTGETVHRAALHDVWADSSNLERNPLYVPASDARAAYPREVGHLLGKNNLSHLRFVPGEKQTMREGMIACCEYQWPHAGHSVAYEDTCLVTPAGGLNFTADEI